MIYLVGTVCLLAGLVAGLVYALWGHERREFRRQDDQVKRDEEREREARERHGQVVRELRDMRALTLGAITQRTNLEADLRRAFDVLIDHAEILDTVQSERRAKRPRQET